MKRQKKFNHFLVQLKRLKEIMEAPITKFFLKDFKYFITHHSFLPMSLSTARTNEVEITSFFRDWFTSLLESTTLEHLALPLSFFKIANSGYIKATKIPNLRTIDITTHRGNNTFEYNATRPCLNKYFGHLKNVSTTYLHSLKLQEIPNKSELLNGSKIQFSLWFGYSQEYLRSASPQLKSVDGQSAILPVVARRVEIIRVQTTRMIQGVKTLLMISNRKQHPMSKIPKNVILHLIRNYLWYPEKWGKGENKVNKRRK